MEIYEKREKNIWYLLLLLNKTQEVTSKLNALLLANTKKWTSHLYWKKSNIKL